MAIIRSAGRSRHGVLLAVRSLARYTAKASSGTGEGQRRTTIGAKGSLSFMTAPMMAALS
jgi:hypothetical protein